MAILWWSEEILLSIGQDAAVSYQASRFCIGLVPSVTLFGFTNMHMYYLNAFQKTRPGMISAVTCIFIQLFFNWLFITQWNWGILGAGLALSISKTY
jgi:Na+-driven multidrug efflux pump